MVSGIGGAQVTRSRKLTEAEWFAYKERNWPSEVRRDCVAEHVSRYLPPLSVKCETCETLIRLMYAFVVDEGVA